MIIRRLCLGPHKFKICLAQTLKYGAHCRSQDGSKGRIRRSKQGAQHILLWEVQTFRQAVWQYFWQRFLAPVPPSNRSRRVRFPQLAQLKSASAPAASKHLRRQPAHNHQPKENTVETEAILPIKQVTGHPAPPQSPHRRRARESSTPLLTRITITAKKKDLGSRTVGECLDVSDDSPRLRKKGLLGSN